MKEEILKEFKILSEKEHRELTKGCFYQNKLRDNYNKIIKILAQTREETIREEIDYWKDVFDNRPKDRDLESDNIAQNFARIEIERLENKLKK